MVGHRKDVQRLGTAGILSGWALQNILPLGTAVSVLKCNNPTVRMEKSDTACLMACLQQAEAEQILHDKLLSA